MFVSHFSHFKLLTGNHSEVIFLSCKYKYTQNRLSPIGPLLNCRRRLSKLVIKRICIFANKNNYCVDNLHFRARIVSCGWHEVTAPSSRSERVPNTRCTSEVWHPRLVKSARIFFIINFDKKRRRFKWANRSRTGLHLQNTPPTVLTVYK